jgi:hypothetical protein
MAMDEKTRELMSQLKDRMLDASDGQITKVIQEARDEALTEAKTIIKEMMVQTILENALGELEGARSKAVPVEKVAPANEALFPTAQARTDTTLRPLDDLGTAQAQDIAESEEQVREEIEAIRRKIAENERLLSQVKASPVETEEVQESPSEDEVSAPREASEKGYGYYVYGIMEGDSSQPIERLPEEGIDPAYPVYALPYQAIQVIVSRVSLQEFGQEVLEANLNDIKWLEAKVRAHQGILETMLASRTLIPMRLCTIYRNESNVQEMLAHYYDDFVDTMARLKGKKEWGVKIYCDSETLAQKVRGVSDRVKDLKTEMAKKSSGAAYFLKKKLEDTVAEEVERVSDECAQCSHDRLSSHAEEAIVNPLQNKEFTGRKEEMILNGAYLVLEEQLAAFRAEMESLGDEYGDLGFGYEMTGPWPPYNFVTISFEEGVTHDPVGG